MNSKENIEPASFSQPITSIAGLRSKRIIKIANFLSQQERDTLFDSVCANQESFQHIGIPDADMGGSLHLSLKPEKHERSEVVHIREACECLSNRIMKILPKLFTNLGVEPFPVSQIPLSLINGLNGHKGTPHNDESGGRFKISLLYYFNRVPKAFRGGALEFYETDAMLQSGHSDEVFARIEHEDNSLIVFPSQTYHGVTDVQLDSDEFEDGRFLAVAFLGSW